MKAIIPVAGEGTRMRPLTHTTPKVLLQVAGKPILGHLLDELEAMGVTDVVLVIGYLGDKIKEYVEANYNFNTNFITQEEQLGLGHAIYVTKDCMEQDEAALIILGDTLFEGDFSEILKGEHNYLGVKEVEDPRRFGVAKVDGDTITGLVEKPDVPPSNLALVGIYYLKNSSKLFSALERQISDGVKTKGEFQLTDALQLMLDEKEEFKIFPIDGWYDCGKPETLLETNRVMLELHPGSFKPPRTVIIDPVQIAENAQVENSVIGPYVSIGENVVVKGCIISNSVIHCGAKLSNLILDESLIGNRAIISGSPRRMNVGDSSEILNN